VHALRHGAAGYEVDTDRGTVLAASVVVATGGLSIPKIGATDFGYRLARQFGLRLVEPRPALVPLTFDGEAWTPYAQLAGLALPVQIETGTKKDRMAFNEDLLFTHRGLSGPAVLQISSYWQAGSAIRLNLAPATDLPDALARAKLQSRKRIANELASLVPSRLADAWVLQDAAWQRPVNEASDKALAAAGRAPRTLGNHPHRHRGLQEGRSHGRWRGHPRPVLTDPGIAAAGPVFHRRSGGRDGLAGRLQPPVGLGQWPRLRHGAGRAYRLNRTGKPL
jgi:predicted flavoprotein YhiN